MSQHVPACLNSLCPDQICAATNQLTLAGLTLLFTLLCKTIANAKRRGCYELYVAQNHFHTTKKCDKEIWIEIFPLQRNVGRKFLAAQSVTVILKWSSFHHVTTCCVDNDQREMPFPRCANVSLLCVSTNRSRIFLG